MFARAEFSRRKLQGVPAFLIDDHEVVGLDIQRIEALLDYTVMGCSKCEARMRIPKNKGKIRITCPKCSHSVILQT